MKKQKKILGARRGAYMVPYGYLSQAKLMCNDPKVPPGSYRRTRLREVAYKPLISLSLYDTQNMKELKTFFTHKHDFH